MKERPILFSGPMVRAILESRKTQTRRVMKSQPYTLRVEGFGYPTKAGGFVSINSPHCLAECPYGISGDRLWVRESFQPLFADGLRSKDTDWQTGKGYAPRYVATEGRTEWMDLDDKLTDRCKPGIHMPRWASRVLLEITDVRVQRLQEISERDAADEGAGATAAVHEEWDGDPDEYRKRFRELWESINVKRGFGWNVNPWVWALTFKRIA